MKLRFRIEKTRSRLISHPPIGGSLIAALLLVVLGPGSKVFAQAQPEPFPSYVFSIVSWDGIRQFHYSTQIPVTRLTAQPQLTDKLRLQPQLGDFFAYLNKSVFAGRDGRSPAQLYTGPTTLLLYDEPPVTTLVEQPNGSIQQITTPEPVARVQLKDPAVRHLLLVSRRQEPTDDGIAYDVVVMDDSPSAFPAGSFRVINFMNHEVGLSVGSDFRQRLQARDMTYIPPIKDEEGPIEVRIFDPTIARERPAYRKVWYYLPDVRQLIFVRRDRYREGYLDLIKISETEEQMRRPPL
ncbi:MAG: hypothetical protein ACFB20_03425 [Opitutales bacterium]